MKTIRRAALALALIAVLGAAARAENPWTYGGLTVLGVGHHFEDEGGATLDLVGLRTKKGENLVGMFFSQGSKNVYFYMNATVWDRVKQRLIKTRDQWDTLGARDFADMGSVKGYTVGNRTGRLTVALQGATALQGKLLLLTGTGGADVPERVTISLTQAQVGDLVSDFYKVDSLLRGTAPQK